MSAPLASSSISDKSRIIALCELLSNQNISKINENDINSLYMKFLYSFLDYLIKC